MRQLSPLVGKEDKANLVMRYDNGPEQIK